MDKLDTTSFHNFGRVFSINVIIVICILLPLFLVPSIPSEGEVDTGWDGVSIDTDFDLNDVVAINSTAAMAVGENGKIFTTSNSGTNWSESESGTINDLNSIDFLDVVIVIGDAGIVLINEGESWIDNSISNASNLYDVSVVSYSSFNDSLIFVSGMNGEIWKWSNGSWIDLSGATGVNSDIYGIDFVNETHGIAVGEDGLIIVTENGGLSWEPSDIPESVNGLSFYDVAFINPIRAFVAGENGTFMRSSGTGDSSIGYNWVVWDTGSTSTIKAISYSSINKVWIVGDNNFIALTKDGGKSFFNQSQPQTIDTDFSGISFSDGFNGFMVGESGIALYTDREGIDPAQLDTAMVFNTFWEYAEYAYPFLKEGMVNTLKIIVLAIMMGFTIGVTFAVFKTSQFNLRIPLSLPRDDGTWNFFNFNPLKFFATIYTDIFRNTPLLVQFFFIYFGLAEIGIDLTFESILGEDRALERAYGSAVVALGLNSGAYQTEIIRSGIQAIPAGQMEAGRSIGLTYIQSMRYVILPQAIRIVIPPLGNETVNLVLNSALASAIGFGEITRKGRLLISLTFETFWTWGLVLLFYFAITYTLANILKYVEKRLKIPGLGLGGEE
ncbi:MAG: ABC transporter permease subunit [Candidatus Poseidoniia archaeon]|nr:ABC transporter permease subunit [Candidatus Poseidoniia archaeon]